MLNLLTCGRRKLPWILICIALACLCLIVIHFFIQYERSTVQTDVKVVNTSPREPEINTLVINSNEKNYYVAAVVDYEVVILPSALATLWINVQFVIDTIAECRKNNVDIVVFPEGSVFKLSFYPISRATSLLISTYVPSAEDFIVPCYHKDYEMSFLRQISCAANQNRIYVAINVMEKENSPKSTAWDGLLFYNTEVVFDRNGMVIARYRKFNLYLERWLQQLSSPDEPEFVTFTTDFGVKFGIFTCFDIVFKRPALELVTKYNITHFIRSSQGISKLPFLSVSTLDFGWSYALDVVVLTSSGPYPTYTKGTNIYFGRRLGTRTYVQPFQTSNIIISPVPKKREYANQEYPNDYGSLKEFIPSQIRQSWFLVEHIYDRMMTEPLIISNENSATFSYKKDEFECAITASWELLKFIPNYQFVAYSGLNNYSVSSINNYIEMCGIALCSSLSTRSFCQLPPRFEDASNLNFKSINISTRSTILDSIRIPAATDSNLVALDGTYFDFGSHTEDSAGKMVNHADMKLIRPKMNLLAFGIYKLASKSTPITNYNYYDNMINYDVIA